LYVPLSVRRLSVAVVGSVLLLALVGIETVLELWHDYLVVRVVAGALYSLLGAVVGYIVGTHRSAR
jgi:hypothetical protein